MTDLTYVSLIGDATSYKKMRGIERGIIANPEAGRAADDALPAHSPFVWPFAHPFHPLQLAHLVHIRASQR